jgi:hypothetical protein
MKSDRSIKWCQKKVLEVLDQKEIRSYLLLSELVLEKGVRSVQESRNLNIALTNLVISKDISRIRNKDGIIVYRRIDKSGMKEQTPS